MNILKEADKLLNSIEGGRIEQYGSIQQNFADAARIASTMSIVPVSPREIYISIIALKLARESYKHKEDNLLDAVAYIAAWNDYEESNNLGGKSEMYKGCSACTPKFSTKEIYGPGCTSLSDSQ